MNFSNWTILSDTSCILSQVPFQRWDTPCDSQQLSSTNNVTGPQKEASVQTLDPAYIPELQLHLRLQTQLLRRCDWLHGSQTAWPGAGSAQAADLGRASTAYLHAQTQIQRVRVVHTLQERGTPLLQGGTHLPRRTHQGLLQQEIQVSPLLNSSGNTIFKYSIF